MSLEAADHSEEHHLDPKLVYQMSKLGCFLQQRFFYSQECLPLMLFTATSSR